MRLAVGADHHGRELLTGLSAWLLGQGHAVALRVTPPGEVVDYPPICDAVCAAVLDGTADGGLVLGGSGQGEEVACNKVRGIRAGLCQDVWSATVSRGNNDSTVLVLGVKVVTPELAREILQTWLTTAFRGGVHRQRLDMVARLERGERLS